MNSVFLALKELLFPKKCAGCGKNGSYFCKNCVARQHRYEPLRCIRCGRPGLDGLTHPKCMSTLSAEGLWIIFKYKGAVKNFIKEIKFHRVRDVEQELAEVCKQIDARLVEYWKRGDFSVSWVPVSVLRRNKRGFNQAELLAQAVAESFGLKMAETLKRVKDTRPQFRLDKRQRLENIEGNFCVKDRIKRGKNLLLVDDVFTTGVTVRECVKVLKRRGAGKVWVLTLAG